MSFALLIGLLIIVLAILTQQPPSVGGSVA
jgi:hypothetical protein